MQGKIAKWWMPDDVAFVDEIPHTATGKILKTALREQLQGLHAADRGAVILRRSAGRPSLEGSTGSAVATSWPSHPSRLVMARRRRAFTRSWLAPQDDGLGVFALICRHFSVLPGHHDLMPCGRIALPGGRRRDRPARAAGAHPAGPLHRRRRRLLAAADARRAAARRHARHLPVLARHRRAPLPVVATPRSPDETLEYTGTAAELLIGFLIAIAILVPINVVFFVADARAWAKSASCQHARLPAAVRARPVRGLSRPALPADPHGLSRRALPSDRLGAALCGLRDVLVGADRAHARPRLSVRAGAASSASRCATPTTAICSGRFEGSGWRLFLRGVFRCGSWSSVPLLRRHFRACSAASIARQSAKRSAATSARSTRFMIGKSARRPRSRSAPSASAPAFCLPLLLFPVFQAMVLRWWLAACGSAP